GLRRHAGLRPRQRPPGSVLRPGGLSSAAIYPQLCTFPRCPGRDHVTIRRMADSEPDIAALFAPLAPAKASRVVLSEARRVLTHLRHPVDAELWGSDMIGALGRRATGARAEADAEVMAELAASLVPAAEQDATPEALALLRVLGAIGSPELQAAAT